LYHGLVIADLKWRSAVAQCRGGEVLSFALSAKTESMNASYRSLPSAPSSMEKLITPPEHGSALSLSVTSFPCGSERDISVSSPGSMLEVTGVTTRSPVLLMSAILPPLSPAAVTFLIWTLPKNSSA